MPAFFSAHGVLTHYQRQHLRNHAWSSNCAANIMQSVKTEYAEQWNWNQTADELHASNTLAPPIIGYGTVLTMTVVQPL